MQTRGGAASQSKVEARVSDIECGSQTVGWSCKWQVRKGLSAHCRVDIEVAEICNREGKVANPAVSDRACDTAMSCPWRRVTSTGGGAQPGGKASTAWSQPPRRLNGSRAPAPKDVLQPCSGDAHGADRERRCELVGDVLLEGGAVRLGRVAEDGATDVETHKLALQLLAKPDATANDLEARMWRLAM